MIEFTPETLTPCIMCVNEENWIHYVLRDLCKVFPKVIVLDTGSDDLTKQIIKQTSDKVELIEESYGKDPIKIGNGRNVLREACPTFWMFIVDADEIWREDRIRNIFKYKPSHDKTDVVMLAGWNVQDVNGKLMLRTNDLANRDGLLSPNIRWNKIDYPFEGYGLVENYISQNKGQYLPARECFSWHMRHTLRSGRNWEAYFRKDKIGFYPYEGPFEEMPEGWLGEIDCRFTNPYLC